MSRVCKRGREPWDCLKLVGAAYDRAMEQRPTITDQPTDDDEQTQEQPLPLEHAGEGETSDDPVEDASADSFPASDPPSFTGSTTD